jgi:MYXO-CTERM domain-containing protein
VTRSGSTSADFRVDQSLTFANVPAPAALSVLGVAGLISRRRKA